MTLAWLRRNFAPNAAVKVRRVRGYIKKRGCFGECFMYVDDEYITRCNIYIERNMSLSMQRETLLHEWAHSLTLFGNDTDEHGDEWALAYGRIYRLFVEWNYGRPRSTEE